MIQAFPRHRGIKRSTKAIIFLGCPHFGSNLAKWGVVAARVLYPLGSNPLVLQGLEYGSLLLHDLHRRFVDSSSDTKVINFFEQRKVRILKLGWFQWEMLVSRNEPRVQLTALIIPPPVVCHRAIGHMAGSHRRKSGFTCRSLQSQQVRLPQLCIHVYP